MSDWNLLYGNHWEKNVILGTFLLAKINRQGLLLNSVIHRNFDNKSSKNNITVLQLNITTYFYQ